MTALQSGDRVYWWKRVTRAVEYPYRAEVVSIGPKRITISVEDPDEAKGRFIRHVALESLQVVARYYAKAIGQGPAILEPAATWGQFTSYFEVGEDLRPVRHVDLFESGRLLSYDRTHWVDEFGMLGDAEINRNRMRRPCGQTVEIEATEFESVWSAARASPLWLQQMATARMGRLGTVPFWFAMKGWYPGRADRRT